jgi:hypothetical protein
MRHSVAICRIDVSGVAYTLQVFAQKQCTDLCSIILSFETVFAALGGWIMLINHADPGIAGAADVFRIWLVQKKNTAGIHPKTEIFIINLKTTIKWIYRNPTSYSLLMRLNNHHFRP